MGNKKDSRMLVEGTAAEQTAQKEEVQQHYLGRYLPYRRPRPEIGTTGEPNVRMVEVPRCSVETAWEGK